MRGVGGSEKVDVMGAKKRVGVFASGERVAATTLFKSRDSASVGLNMQGTNTVEK